MFKSILVPVDGSAHSQRAIELATDLAEKYGAKLEFVHVGVMHEVPPELQRIAEIEGVADRPESTFEFVERRIVATAEEYAQNHGAKSVQTTVVVGDPASEIVRTAKDRGADMIVMGCRGRGHLTGLLLGSVSHKVVSLAPCTCVTVH